MYTYYIDISGKRSIEVDFETLYYFMPILIESTTMYQDWCKHEKHYVRGLLDIDNEEQMKLVKEFNEWEDKI